MKNEISFRKKDEHRIKQSRIYFILTVVVIVIGVVIAIPIVYTSGRDQASLGNAVLSNVTESLFLFSRKK